LTKAPELSPETYEAQFDHLLSCPSTYFIVVLASSTTGAILGSASLVVEHKFLRNAGKVGHIEDVVVSPSLKGKNLGKTLVTGLTELAKTLGCYKVILDCDPKNVGKCPRTLFTIVLDLD
jgi:glucosamine-phosphate N-acetyltransferase